MTITQCAFRETNKTILNNSWTDDYTYGAMAVSSTYTYSASHNSFSDFSAHVIGDEIYITGKQASLINNNDRVKFDCDPLDFTGQGLTASGIVVFTMPQNSFNSNSKLAFYFKFSTPQSLESLVYPDEDYGIYNWIKPDTDLSYETTNLLLATYPYLTTGIKCQLVSSAYTFDETHQYLSDFTGLLGSAVNLSGKAISISSSGANTILSASRAEFPALTSEVSAAGLVVYLDNTEKELLFFVAISSVTAFDQYDSIQLSNGLYYLRGDTL